MRKKEEIPSIKIVTKFFCDICGKELASDGVYQLDELGLVGGSQWDLCSNCCIGIRGEIKEAMYKAQLDVCNKYKEIKDKWST